jgi:hypothetical protein
VKQQLALLRADMRLEPGSILQRCAEGMFEERTVKVYKDHLARDYENFAIGDSCDTGWKVRMFNVYPRPIMSRWNCHGGALHAYDGSEDGSVGGKPHFTDDWTTVLVEGTDRLTYPFSTAVRSAIGGMHRGDVVTYHCTSKDGVYGPGHSATSIGGGTTWGSNNGPLVYDGGWHESWKWYETSAESCAADLRAHWPYAFPGWTMDYIMIHRRP